MSLTPSTMMPLGSPAPDFELPDPAENLTRSLTALKGDKATLIMFICNHCPYVVHLEEALRRLGTDYQHTGLGIIAISANDAERYPHDGPDKMAKKGYPFPYLYDESQAVAKAYDAACTPDFFLFDATMSCVYRGQFDDSRPGNGKPVTGKDLRDAIEATLAGKPVDPNQKPSAGCNIKWK